MTELAALAVALAEKEVSSTESCATFLVPGSHGDSGRKYPLSATWELNATPVYINYR